MAGSIKGITVEIGGDTTKLNKALNEVDSNSKSLQRELKGVNSLLKMDPSNVDLIKQKQDLLTESITNTKGKLTILKSTQEQVQAQFDKGEITSEQYRDFQREIASTENKLKALTNEAKDFGVGMSSSLTNAKDKIDEFGTKTTKVGKALLPVTAGIAAVGTAGVAAFNAVDEGADNVIRATGATGEAAEKLENSYKKVAQSVVGDFGDIGSTLGEVNTRFGFTGEELENCTEKFMKFSEVTGTDALTSVQLVSRAMGDAGIDSSEYSSVLDSLAVAAQASGISIDKLTENLTKYGAPMRALGFETQESIAIFSSWEKAGVNTEIAFSGMKKAISNWSAEGKDSREEFKKTLEEIKSCPDIASATTKSIEIFGAKAGPDLADAIKGGRFEFEEMLNVIAGADGTVDNTFDGLVDGGYDAELAMQNVKVTMGEVGEIIMDILAPMFQSVSEALKSIAQKFSSLSPETQKMIIIIGGIVAAVGPLLIIVGKMATGVSALIGLYGKIATAKALHTTAIAAETTATGAATVAQNGLNLAFLACPLTWIVIAILAVVAAFVVLWNKSEGFRNFWIGLWNNIKELTGAFIDALVNFFTVTIPEAWNGLVLFFQSIPGWFSNLWGQVRDITQIVWESIKIVFFNVWNSIVSLVMAIITPFINGVMILFNLFKDGISMILTGLKDFFMGIWEVIKNIFLGAILLIIDLVTGNFTKLKTDAEGIFNNLKAAFSLIWQGIKGVFTGVVTAIANFLTAAWNGIVTVATTIWNGLKNFFSGIWNGIKNLASSAWNGFKNIIVSICNGVSTSVVNIFNGIVNFFRNLPSTLYNLGVSIFSSLKKGIGSILNTLGSYITNGFNDAIKFITSLPSQAITWGKDFIQGLIDGIKSMIGGVVDAVSSVGERIRNFLHFSVPDEGPLTDYETWMPDFMDGLAKGINNSKYLVTDAIKGLSTDMSVGVYGNMPSTDIEKTKIEPNKNNGVNVTNNFYGKVESPYEVAKASKKSMRDLQFV